MSGSDRERKKTYLYIFELCSRYTESILPWFAVEETHSEGHPGHDILRLDLGKHKSGQYGGEEAGETVRDQFIGGG